MVVRGQFATCVFALHAPVRSSAAFLQAPHHQPPNQQILGCNCLLAPLVVSRAAMSLATESVESGVVEPSAFVPCKNNFPIRLTTAGQLWLQIRAIEPQGLLHTYPAHSQMGMGSLCASIFFQQAWFVH